MGVYSVVLADSEIRDSISGCKSVAILGCPACANSSIAFDRERPVSKRTVDEATGKTINEPIAIKEECQRLQAMLEEEGIAATIELLPGPCVLSDERQLADSELIDRCSKADAVLALCCAGGVAGMHKRLGKKAKTIAGMETMGSSLSYTVVDKDTGLVYMDRKRSKMIPVANR